MRVTASEVCRALRADVHPESGWMRYQGKPILPKVELWLEDACMWVRASGVAAGGWRGGQHFYVAFGLIDRFRVRRAVRRWAARRSL